MKSEPLRVMQLVLNHPWAITRPALEQILDILDTRVAEAANIEAVAARLGRSLDNASWRSEVRGSTAVLNVDGPLFRYANLFSMVSGASSVEMLGLDLQAALDDQGVRQVLLNINSPGGQADGINEMADAIRTADTVKPVYAYVGGTGASAAYWLAAAARQIVANESAFLGSIGVVIALEDRNGAAERQGVKRYEFISSQSPRKRADPATEAGRQQIQEMADNLAQLFIDRVAGFRKVTTDHVLDHFGRGGMVMGRAAIRAGMADDIGSLEAFLTELNSPKQEVFSMAANQTTGSPNPNPSPPTQTGSITALPNGDVIVNGIVIPSHATIKPGTMFAGNPDPTADTERARIAAILTLPEAQGREALAQQLALTPGLDADSAKRILAAAPRPAEPPAKAANPLAAAMAGVPNPKVGAGSEAEDDSPQAEAARILAFAPARHRVKRAS